MSDLAQKDAAEKAGETTEPPRGLSTPTMMAGGNAVTSAVEVF